MRLIGMMACRNEDWVIQTAIRVAMEWCDALVVLDHSSTDDTPHILEYLKESQFKDRLICLSEADPSWSEMRHRQAMLEAARSAGATHLAIIDADELLTANMWERVRGEADRMRPNQLMQLPGYNLRGSLDKYHLTGIWGDRWFSSVFMDSSFLNWNGDRFHHREPMGGVFSPWRPINQGQGGILHLWGSDERRLRAKHALYKMTETLRWPNKSRSEIDRLYSLAFNPSLNLNFDQSCRYADVPPCWWAHREHLKLDVIPWQEVECCGLYERHGAHRFSGLDLFNVCGEAP
jgi:glycosyl transferase family 2